MSTTNQKITADIGGKIRGGEIIETHDNGDVTAEFYTPKRIERRLSENEYVPSEAYEQGQSLEEGGA